MATPTLEAGFPVTATLAAVTTQSLTTATFNVNAGRLVVVLVAYDADPNTNFPTTVSWNGGTPAGAAAFVKATSIAGTSSHVGTFTDSAEVWTAWVSSPLTGVSVTCALSAAASTGQDRAVIVGAWRNTQATLGGVNAVFATASAARAVSVACIGTGSVVVGICASFFTGGAGVADANSTVDANGNAGADTQAALHLTTPTTGPGTYTIGLTGVDTDRVAAAIELLASGGGMAQSTRGPWSNPRLAARGPGSRFRHATWASTDVGTAPSAVDLGGGIIAGAAVITADLSLAEALAGSIAGQGALTADLGLAEALAGSIAGQGTLTADLKEAIALAGNLAGAATLTANLSLAVALAGAIAGQATLSASLVEAIALSGNISGIASLAASIALAEALAGNIAGQATVTLDLQTGTPIAGSVAGAAIVTADLSLAVALAGSIAGTATITGRLSLPRGTVTYSVFVFDD